MSREVSKIAYTTRDKAAFAGFCEVLQRSDWDKFEYGFFVLLTKSKPLEYRFTKPEKGTEIRASLLASKGEPIRAFCHTHPKSEHVGSFGENDKDHFKEAIKNPDFLSIAYYLMNQYNEVRLAQSVGDFLQGKDLEFKSGSCPKYHAAFFTFP